jgi:molecular chaperone GrpE
MATKKEKKKKDDEVIEEQVNKAQASQEEVKESQETCEDNKIDETVNQIEKLEQEKNSYLDMAQRIRAEFDNYKKRNATLRTDSLDDGVRTAVEAMLPVIDNLERALDAADCENEQVASIKEGVDMIFKQMMDGLETLGLEEIKALGETFDPMLHHAVMQGEANEDYSTDTVMEVFQKGYSVRGKIVRHSMVKVAK